MRGATLLPLLAALVSPAQALSVRAAPGAAAQRGWPSRTATLHRARGVRVSATEEPVELVDVPAGAAEAPEKRGSVSLVKVEAGDEKVGAMAGLLATLVTFKNPVVALAVGGFLTAATSDEDSALTSAMALTGATLRQTVETTGSAVSGVRGLVDSGKIGKIGEIGKVSLPSVPVPKAPAGASPAAQLRRAVPLGAAGDAERCVREYFDCWNRRDMLSAVNLFTEDCRYEDTLYAGAFEGKKKVREHLLRVAGAVPDTFSFVVDDICAGGAEGGLVNVGVQWHVEDRNSGKSLPFARGASMYKVDAGTGLIASGFDVPEPTLKSGGFSLGLLSFATGLIEQPLKVLPLGFWAAYCYVLFLSEQAPGLPATALDPATWEMVRSLSFNFWLILPIGFPQYAAAAQHPVLEGSFNFTLAWAALFAIFAADGRPGRYVGMGPFLGGMQALTNAIYLPYLVLRKPESEASLRLSAPPGGPAERDGKPVFAREALGGLAAFGENRLLPVVLAGVMGVSAYWALQGRPEFGDLDQRIESFVALAKSDRLTFAFVVDMALFGLFQGWLVDDDMTRRGLKGPQRWTLGAIAKLLPGFGLAFYGLFRPSLEVEDE